ncbi:MAG TPA: hypothetical protein VE573_18865 [Nitrososphaeraceae archaeon]|nr:hypothetical protein [Nitrososphaeraceae archaeon]
MKIECRDCWAKPNIQEDTVAGRILSYPEYGAGFVIGSASSSTTTTTTTKNKVESKIAKDLDKDREQ